MVGLTRRRVKGQLYWYATKSARINGKPRVIWQKYLGTAEKITNCIIRSRDEGDINVQTMPLGTVAALASINNELGFIDIIDRNTDKKPTKGLTVGQYLLLQLMGRAEGNLSRKAIAEWYPESVAKLVLATRHKMNAKNLLRHLDYLTKERIHSIEDELALKLKSLGIMPNKILWDTTNFFTQIEKGELIPRKAYSKEKRNDKNLIGVGLAVSNENIPFFHETYEANKHDSQVFSEVLDAIVERLNKLSVDTDQAVMIMDKGNNSDENVAGVLKRTHIIGTLKADQSKDYLEVPMGEYSPIGEHLMSYRTKGTHYGENFTIVVTYNTKTEKKQRLTYEENKVEILDELGQLKHKVEFRKRRGRKWTLKRAFRAIVDIIPINMRAVFDYDVKKKVGRGGGLIVEYSVNPEKERLRRLSFGKIIHFTDLHDWTDTQISESYNSKYQIEDDFKWLKDKLLVPVKPVHVRKDGHIRAHVFICLMGLLFYRYIQYKLRKAGTSYSPQELSAILENIRLALVVTGNNKKGKFLIERMDPKEAAVFSTLGMGHYINV
jgi:transposase